MKILITSDNHLGYKETDPLLSLDSFRAFEEILQNSKDCDLMINGGDLFHSNRPSRFTMYRTISLLKKYTLGDRPISFKSNVELNFNKPNMRISLPILIINGNHDDPCGFGSLSALDVLHETGLVNYVGRNHNLDNITIEPIIIEKEKIVAFYFLSHIKDTRLFRLFLQNRIVFKEVEADINILVVHQNRIERTGKDFLSTDFIPDFFNLIIFGHEHDPLIFEKNNQTFLQCGSTVRTSCCEGEVGEKYYYKLEIDEDVKIEKINIKNMRPFIFDTISVESNVEIAEKLDDMIDSVVKCDRCKDSVHFCNNCRPLIRLRLYTTEILNKLPFQNEYSERVANPADMLLLLKKKKTERDIEEQMEEINTTKDESKSFQEIFLSILQNSKLNVIPEYLATKKVEEFVEKDNKTAISELFGEILDLKSNNTDNEEAYFSDIKNRLNNKYISYFKAMGTNTGFYSQQGGRTDLFMEDSQPNTQNIADDKIKTENFLLDGDDENYEFGQINIENESNLNTQLQKSHDSSFYEIDDMEKVRRSHQEFAFDDSTENTQESETKNNLIRFNFKNKKGKN